MAAPLGGGEYVQDNRRSPNRIEPHSMPRPGTDLKVPPVVMPTSHIYSVQGNSHMSHAGTPAHCDSRQESREGAG